MAENQRGVSRRDALTAMGAWGAAAMAGDAEAAPQDQHKSGGPAAAKAATGTGDDFRRELARLVPHLPEEVQDQVLQEALAAARGTQYKWQRAYVLKELADCLARRPRQELFRLWLGERKGINLRHFLARRTREDLLSDLGALTPIIVAMGGEKAIEETFRAIRDVGRWCEPL